MSPPRRNDPCPCGSGKKYKRCCLAKEAAAQASQTAQSDSGPAIALDWLRTRYRRAYRQAATEFLEPLLTEDGSPPSGVEAYAEMIDINLGEWVLTEAELKTSSGTWRAIDLLRQEGPRISETQQAYLEAIASTPLLLYEIVNVRRDEALVLRDTLALEAQAVTVQERAATHGARPGMFLGARVVECDGHLELSGAIYPFDSSHGLALAAQLGDRLGGGDYLDEAARRVVAQAIAAAWLAGLARPRSKPSIVDASTGTPLLLTTDHYEVVDAERLLAAMAAQPDVDGDPQHGWARLAGGRGDDPRRIRYVVNPGKKPGRVELFSRSEELADEAREWFEAVAGDAVRFLARELSDPRHGLDGEPGTKTAPTPVDLPPEEHTRLIQQVLEQTYRNWCEEPIPALGGKTPRQAATTQRGKAAVLRLLRLYEANEWDAAERENRPAASLGFLYDALGIDRSS